MGIVIGTYSSILIATPILLNMKIRKANKESKNKYTSRYRNLENKAFISAYGKNYVIVDKKKYHNLLFFFNDQIKVINNNLDVFDEAILKHLYLTLKTSKFDIVLFGTGESLQKIPEKLKKYLIEQKYNFETMSTYSAFNTHNVLLSENET